MCSESDLEQFTFGAVGGITSDQFGNIFVLDVDRNALLKVDVSGTVSTVTSFEPTNSKGKRPASESSSGPSGVAIDKNGTIFVSDTDNHRILMVTSEGEISVFAGNDSPGYRNGEGFEALFHSPKGLVVDGEGCLYVCDSENHCIRKVTPDAAVSTLAGNLVPEKEKRVNYLATAVEFPQGLGMDGGGNLIVAQGRQGRDNHCILKITPSGDVSTIAGCGREGSVDGPGKIASFSCPGGVAVDNSGNVVVCDTGNHCIRLVAAKLVPRRSLLASIREALKLIRVLWVAGSCILSLSLSSILANHILPLCFLALTLTSRVSLLGLILAVLLCHLMCSAAKPDSHHLPLKAKQTSPDDANSGKNVGRQDQTDTNPSEHPNGTISHDPSDPVKSSLDPAELESGAKRNSNSEYGFTPTHKTAWGTFRGALTSADWLSLTVAAIAFLSYCFQFSVFNPAGGELGVSDQRLMENLNWVGIYRLDDPAVINENFPQECCCPAGFRLVSQHGDALEAKDADCVASEAYTCEGIEGSLAEETAYVCPATQTGVRWLLGWELLLLLVCSVQRLLHSSHQRADTIKHFRRANSVHHAGMFPEKKKNSRDDRFLWSRVLDRLSISRLKTLSTSDELRSYCESVWTTGWEEYQRSDGLKHASLAAYYSTILGLLFVAFLQVSIASWVYVLLLGWLISSRSRQARERWATSRYRWLLYTLIFLFLLKYCVLLKFPPMLYEDDAFMSIWLLRKEREQESGMCESCARSRFLLGFMSCSSSVGPVEMEPCFTPGPRAFFLLPDLLTLLAATQLLRQTRRTTSRTKSAFRVKSHSSLAAPPPATASTHPSQSAASQAVESKQEPVSTTFSQPSQMESSDENDSESKAVVKTGNVNTPGEPSMKAVDGFLGPMGSRLFSRKPSSNVTETPHSIDTPHCPSEREYLATVMSSDHSDTSEYIRISPRDSFYISLQQKWIYVTLSCLLGVVLLPSDSSVISLGYFLIFILLVHRFPDVIRHRTLFPKTKAACSTSRGRVQPKAGGSGSQSGHSASGSVEREGSNTGGKNADGSNVDGSNADGASWFNPRIIYILTVYNYGVLVLKLLYCAPFFVPLWLDFTEVSWREEASCLPGTSGCERWNEVAGLWKLKGSCGGVSCTNTFHLGRGGVTGQVVLFLVALMQLHILSSPTYQQVVIGPGGVLRVEEDRRRTRRAAYIQRLKHENRAKIEKQLLKKRQAVAAVGKLVNRVSRWDDLLTGPDHLRKFTPGPPLNLRHTVGQDGSVTLRWDPPQVTANPPITAYVVTRQLLTNNFTFLGDYTDPLYILPDETDDDNKKALSDDEPQIPRQITIADLEPEKEYQFRVEALNEEGCGSASMPSQRITIPSQTNLKLEVMLRKSKVQSMLKSILVPFNHLRTPRKRQAGPVLNRSQSFDGLPLERLRSIEPSTSGASSSLRIEGGDGEGEGYSMEDSTIDPVPILPLARGIQRSHSSAAIWDLIQKAKEMDKNENDGDYTQIAGVSGDSESIRDQEDADHGDDVALKSRKSADWNKDGIRKYPDDSYLTPRTSFSRSALSSMSSLSSKSGARNEADFGSDTVANDSLKGILNSIQSIEAEPKQFTSYPLSPSITSGIRRSISSPPLSDEIGTSELPNGRTTSSSSSVILNPALVFSEGNRLVQQSSSATKTSRSVKEGIDSTRGGELSGSTSGVDKTTSLKINTTGGSVTDTTDLVATGTSPSAMAPVTGIEEEKGTRVFKTKALVGASKSVWSNMYASFVEFMSSNVDTAMFPDPIDKDEDPLYLLRLVVRVIRSHTSKLCWVTFVVNAMVNANLLSLVYPVSMFLVALIYSPTCGHRVWQSYIAYTEAVLLLKLVFQLPLFCMDASSDQATYDASGVLLPGEQAPEWRASIQPFCPKNLPFNWHSHHQHAQSTALFFVVSKPPDESLLLNLMMDVVLLAVLLLHKSHVQALGCWHASSYNEVLPKYDVKVDRFGDSALGRVLNQYERDWRTFFHRVLAADQILVGKNDRTVEELLEREQEEQNAIARQSDVDFADPLSTSAVSRLDRRDTLKEMDRILQHQVEHIFSDAVDRPGIDVYIPTLICQSLIILYSCCTLHTWTPSTSSIIQNLEYNQFSISVILTVIIGIGALVAERYAYLNESVIPKLLLHYFATIFGHVYIFLWVPLNSGVDTSGVFHKNGWLQGLYVMVAVYLGLGAIQLRYGYLQGSQYGIAASNISANKYGPIVPRLVYSCYMLVPFLFEARTLLDWALTSTCLDIMMWFTVEWTFTATYKNQLEMAKRKVRHLIYSGRTPLPVLDKVWVGLLSFAGILLLLVMPMLVFSTLNPGLSPNPVTESALTISLLAPYGEFELWSQRQSVILGMTGKDYRLMLSTTDEMVSTTHSAQCGVFNSFPDQHLQLTDSALERLERALCYGGVCDGRLSSRDPYYDDVQLKLSLTLLRKGPPGNTQLLARWTQGLNSTQRTSLFHLIKRLPEDSPTPPHSSSPLLNGTILPASSSPTTVPFSPTGSESPTSVVLEVERLYPLGVELPANQPPSALDKSREGWLGLSFARVQDGRHMYLHAWNPVLPGDSALTSTTLGPEEPQPLLDYYNNNQLPRFCSSDANSTIPTSSSSVSGGGEEVTGGVGLASSSSSSSSSSLDRHQWSSPSGPVLALLSDHYVAGVVESLGLASYTVVGLYTLILVTVNSLVRQLLLLKWPDVLWREMQDSSDLMDLLSGIRFLRALKYNGRTKDEVKLYQVLIRIIQNPEFLLKVTQRKMEFKTKQHTE